MKYKHLSLYFNLENPDEQYIITCLERLCREELSSFNGCIKRMLKSGLERKYGVRKQK